ncbi:activity-regulated cytoskeleton associated protein 2-like [Musca autumnalis]|uniref:activity-regulated cytoskeleton associated protein 2-like n=1 Tax=Musca autumnalis TaxID=221902 RepID=UPI003CEA1E68
MNKRNGSFAHCTARFRGQREPAAVEEFLTAITVFKDIENISDTDAVTGLQLLLEGYAANWWIGVKKNVTTFEQAKTLIKKTFSPPVPDWRLFTQIYEHKQQRTEHTDTFICKKRLLFSQLKSAVDEEIQLNLIFGLLRQNFRERVKRESITSFEELLSACREAELSLAEYNETTTTSLAETKAEAKTACCAICRTFKHETVKCWKKKMSADNKHSAMMYNNNHTQNSNKTMHNGQPTHNNIHH